MKDALNISNLISRIANENDEKAFRYFFEFFSGRMLQFAQIILKNNDLAEDVVMEVFAGIWEKREKLPQIKNLSNYLYVLVKNKSLDYIRKNKYFIKVDPSNNNICERVINQHPEKVFLDNELLENINKAILNLPKKSRLVYRLLKEEGLSYHEAAKLLNISYKTIDNHIALAMHRIRSQINEYTKTSEKI